MNWPTEDMTAMNAFYGDPRGKNGESDLNWECKNLVSWVPPYPLFYSDQAHTPLHHLRFNKKCVAVFDSAFRDVLATLGHDYIVAHHLDISGGSFCYRVERGGSHLSIHSWGAAIDMDPANNPFPRKWRGGKQMDAKFATILQQHGLIWRGAKGDIDPMHFRRPCANLH